LSLKGAFFGYRRGKRRDDVADEDWAPAGITGNAALFPELVEDDPAPSLSDDRCARTINIWGNCKGLRDICVSYLVLAYLGE
jgi:hypothetical protein